MEKAIGYGMAALRIDLADVGGNVKDRCHIASMGGTWMMLAYGLGGMRDDDGMLSFRPRRAPEDNAILRFPVTYRGQLRSVGRYLGHPPADDDRDGGSLAGRIHRCFGAGTWDSAHSPKDARPGRNCEQRGGPPEKHFGGLPSRFPSVAAWPHRNRRKSAGASMGSRSIRQPCDAGRKSSSALPSRLHQRLGPRLQQRRGI
jgi:hypothetical protein